MKKYNWQKSIGLVLLFCIGGCIESFQPPAISVAGGFLVINGSLDIDQGSSTIELTRSQDLTQTDSAIREHNASVSIEEVNGNSYQLTESGTGTYKISGLNLEYGVKYRLRIKTSGSKEYVSAFVIGKQTPDIDTILTDAQNGGLQVYVNTHDPNNNTKYYRWEYEETWEYTSGARSDYVFNFNVDTAVKVRTNNVFVCWISSSSTEILIGSSAKLSQDIINKFSLTLANAVKTKIKYSILVKQYAMTVDEYNYWQMLEKNTENTGGLFSPQPTQLTGNFKCVTDSNEVVLGYFSAGSAKQKRIFRGSEIPPVYYYDMTCPLDTLTIAQIENPPHVYDTAISYLIGPVTNSMGMLVGYTKTNIQCADCSSQGGKKVPPDFWR